MRPPSNAGARLGCDAGCRPRREANLTSVGEPAAVGRFASPYFVARSQLDPLPRITNSLVAENRRDDLRCGGGGDRCTGLRRSVDLLHLPEGATSMSAPLLVRIRSIRTVLSWLVAAATLLVTT